MLKKSISIIVGLAVVSCFYAAQAEFYPERIYKERKKTSLDFGWKFFKGTPTGTPSDSAYSDALWATVNVPHSASYDDPEPVPSATSSYNDEGKRYQGISWYRKYFTVPQSAKHTGKILIEFEGAMQIATVWLNGKPLGVHSNSGFTWFQFDITNTVSLTGTNVLSVKLDNSYNSMVPPGRTLDPSIGAPDYYLFSGLYRNVWLICTDACSVPLWSQQISTPNASTSSVKVHITTPVVSATAGTISVHYVIAYPSTSPVASGVQTKTLNSAGTAIFDTSITINNPTLWNYRTPNLYYLYTQVFKDGELVDDYVDRFGARSYTWTPADGFALNGVYDTLRAVSLHQSIGWIENALPRSRFFKEVGMIKQMGANMIRCAHFPRDPSFYNACDEIGMLVFVEVPTWGCCLNGWTYPDSLFLRLDSCMREMIEVGYNHPSIIAWGLFNEPPASYSLPKQIPSVAAVAHKMDSTRYTYLADNGLNNLDLVNETDIVGENYYELNGACANVVKRILNTEYHEGWHLWCFRGAAGGTTGDGAQADDMSANGYAHFRWNLWTALLSAPRVNKLAGATMWCFNDYWSDHLVNPMGVADHYRIPKAVYYLFRKYWTQVSYDMDFPTPNITASALRLDADTNRLIADSTDVSIITASLRSADGRCVDNTNVGTNADTIPVTFTVNGPANYFGTGIGKLYGGKCALMLKSTNTPGTITVSATGKGFTAASITIQSVAPDTSSLPFLTPILCKGSSAAVKRPVTILQQKNRIVIVFADKKGIASEVRIVNFKGETISCPVSLGAKSLTLNTKKLTTGYYLLSVDDKAAGKLTKKIFIVK